MNESEYQRWWQLHIRLARGETLTFSETQLYESGIAAQDQEDENWLVNNFDSLRLLQSQIGTLSKQQNVLQVRSKKLDQDIRLLEASYQDLTGHTLTATLNAAH